MLREYQPRWSDFSAEPLTSAVPKVPEGGIGTFGTAISTHTRDETEDSVRRLTTGNAWLTSQHELWLNNDPAAADDSAFYRALDAWEKLERQVRNHDRFNGCIFGSGKHCPQDAVVSCSVCMVSNTSVSRSGSLQQYSRPSDIRYLVGLGDELYRFG